MESPKKAALHQLMGTPPVPPARPSALSESPLCSSPLRSRSAAHPCRPLPRCPLPAHRRGCASGPWPAHALWHAPTCAPPTVVQRICRSIRHHIKGDACRETSLSQPPNERRHVLPAGHLTRLCGEEVAAGISYFFAKLIVFCGISSGKARKAYDRQSR
eukprot:364522-Chlamydomonas_euryale.AAC.9